MSSVLRSPEISSQSRVLNVDGVAITKIKTRKVEKDEGIDDKLAVGRSTEKPEQNTHTVVEGATREHSPEMENQIVDDPQSSLEEELERVKIELAEIKTTIEEQAQLAEKRGYDEGFKKGLEDSDAVLMEKLESFDNLAQSVNDAIEKAVIDNEDMLVEIAFTALCKVFGEFVQTKEGVVAAVRQTTSKLLKRDKLTIRVPEKDYEIIKEEKHKLSLSEELDCIEIIPDPHIKFGGCIVETSGGGLDGRLEIQLNKLMETLLNTRAQNTSRKIEADE